LGFVLLTLELAERRWKKEKRENFRSADQLA
jgi:hypothetical protein